MTSFSDNSQPAPRRSFLARAAASLAAVVALPRVATALTPDAPTESATRGAPDASEAWLANLEGKHRQLFDVSTMRDGGVALTRVLNFLGAYEEAYGLKPPAVRAMIGAHGSGLGYVLGDALWAKYDLGERYMVQDPLTGQPAKRNPYLRKEPSYTWSADFSIRALQSVGVRFIACNRSMRAFSRTLSAAGLGDAAAIRDELEAGLIEGAFVVPAMVLATNRAQEQGFTYIYVG